MKKRPYIMVVGHDQKMLRMLKRILEQEGYEVGTAADGKTALALLEGRKPDLVILTITTPELGDFEALDLMR